MPISVIWTDLFPNLTNIWGQAVPRLVNILKILVFTLQQEPPFEPSFSEVSENLYGTECGKTNHDLFLEREMTPPKHLPKRQSKRGKKNLKVKKK